MNPNLSSRGRRSSRDLLTVRRLLTLAALVAAWCALWGSVSWANVLSGVLVGLAALSIGVGSSGRGGVRIVPMLRFAGVVAADMAVSTIMVARAVIATGDRPAEGIIAVPISAPATHHLLLLVVAITVTPGTAVVAAETDGSVLYLHVLDVERRADVEAHTRKLADLACAALPVAAPGSGSGSERIEVPS